MKRWIESMIEHKDSKFFAEKKGQAQENSDIWEKKTRNLDTFSAFFIHKNSQRIKIEVRANSPSTFVSRHKNIFMGKILLPLFCERLLLDFFFFLSIPSRLIWTILAIVHFGSHIANKHWNIKTQSSSSTVHACFIIIIISASPAFGNEIITPCMTVSTYNILSSPDGQWEWLDELRESSIR